MRKQSSVVVVENVGRKSIVQKPNEDFGDDAYAYLGLVVPPNPLEEKEKSQLRKISINHGFTGGSNLDSRGTIVAKNRKQSEVHKISPGSSLEKGNGSIDSSQSAVAKKEDAESLNGYSAMRQSTTRANALVDSILKEDMRWAGVPEQNYHTFKDGDFSLKLESSKIQSILADVKAMEFAPDLIEMDAEAERTASQDTKEEIIRDAIELRAKDKQKIVTVYEKFRAFRKRQDFEFGERLRRIRDEKGLDRLEARAQERALQVARLERVVSQKKQFLSIVAEYGAQSSDQIRALLELNAQDEVEGLLRTLEKLQSEISQLLVEKKELVNQAIELRDHVMRELPGVDKFDREHADEMRLEEKELRLSIDNLEQEITKYTLGNSKTREMILVMDMKSSSKEETLTNVLENSAEAQDIRHFKKMISNLQQQREEHLQRAKELETVLLEMEESSREPPKHSLSLASNMSEVSSGSGISRGMDCTVRQPSDGEIPAGGSDKLSSLSKNKMSATNSLGKKGLSEYTIKFQQIMEASLRPAATFHRLLPSEFDELDMDMNKSSLPGPGGTVNVMDALREAQIKRKASALDTLNASRQVFNKKTAENDDDTSDDEEEGEEKVEAPPLDISDYGLEAAYEQLKKIFTTICLEEPEVESDNEKEGNYRRRKVELGVLLNAGGDLLKALGVDESGRAVGKAITKAKVKKGDYSDTDSDSDASGDSQQSSRSYLHGVEKYQTRKQLQNAIVRRRNKLKDLQEVGKQLNKKLNTLTKKLADMKSKRFSTYGSIIKAMEGDPANQRPKALFQSDVAMNALREQNLRLVAEGKKWKKKLNNLLENPHEDLLARKKLSTVVSDTMSDGILMSTDLPVQSSSTFSLPKSVHSASGSEKSRHSVYESKPLTGYSSRENVSQSGIRTSPIDQDVAMTESMSTLLSSYQLDIKQPDTSEVDEEPRGVPEVVVVDVPSVKQLHPELQPTSVVAPPPQIIAPHGPVSVPLTPYSFEGTVGMPNAPPPARTGESGYSQVLMELASQAVDGRISPVTLRDMMTSSFYNQKVKQNKHGRQSRAHSAGTKKRQGDESLPTLEESMQQINELIRPAVPAISLSSTSERRSLSPSHVVELAPTIGFVQGPGDFDLLATREAVQHERTKVLTLEVSFPLGSRSSHGGHSSNPQQSTDPPLQSHTIYGETIVNELSKEVSAVMKLPHNYQSTGNARLLEIDDLGSHTNQRGTKQFDRPHKPNHSTYDSDENEELSRLANAVVDSAAAGGDGSLSPLHLNPPRVGKGPYTTPRNIDLYHEVEDSIEEAPVASHEFHSHKLQAPNHIQPIPHERLALTEEDDDMTDAVNDEESPASHRVGGIYMREDSAPPQMSDTDRFDLFTSASDRRVQLRTAPVNSEHRPQTDTVNITETAGDRGINKSVLTRQLLGRSTWDRVVGMQSSFARDFISTQLKDPRIVFIINTAGSEQRAYSPLPHAGVTATEISYLFEATLPDNEVEDLTNSKENDGYTEKSPLMDDSGESYDFFPAETPPLSAPRPQSQGLSLTTLRPPQSPKPSFSSRRNYGIVIR